MIALASEGRVLVSSDIIKKRTKLITTFKPVLVLNRNSSIQQDYKVKPMEKLDVIQYSIIGIVMGGLIFVMLCGGYLYCCNRKVVNNTVILDKDEKVKFIEKTNEEITFIVKIKI